MSQEEHLRSSSQAEPSAPVRAWPWPWYESRVMRILQFCLPSLFGILQACSLSDGHGHTMWWLQLFVLAGLLVLLHSCTTWKQAVAVIGLFASCWLAAVFWWLYIALHDYGGLPFVLSLLAVAILAVALGCYYTAAALLYWHMRSRSPISNSLLFSACWTLAELARGQWLTGFPWGAIGYAHVDGPLAWTARWIGVYGTGSTAALLASLLAASISMQRRCLSSALFLSALAGLHIGSAWQERQLLERDSSTPSRQAISVALLQGNISVTEKFDPSGIRTALEWYGQQFKVRTEQLVIAPETALPVFAQSLPPGYLHSVTHRFLAGQQALLVGMPDGDPHGRYTNAVRGFKPGDDSFAYNKSHLVPFGEYTPTLLQWFNTLLELPLNNFTRGEAIGPLFEWRGERFAPNICFEDVFGDELARQFIAQAPTILVNFSNVGWFSSDTMVAQHLQISRMRTLELGRPMLRASNTGATAIIDDRGHVQSLAPFGRQYILSGSVTGVGHAGTAADITPYVRWVSYWGLSPLWLGGLLLIGVSTRRLTD